jgi:hypothetical protein
MPSQLENDLKRFPLNDAATGLRLFASTLEHCADAAQRLEVGSAWVRDNVAAIDAMAELAEQLLAAARRAKHAMRSKLKDGD